MHGSEYNELMEVRKQCGAVTNQSLDCTRNMVTMCEESRSTGNKTMQMLGTQRTKLERTDETLDNVFENVEEAEANLRKLDKLKHLIPRKGKNYEKIIAKEQAQERISQPNNPATPTKQPTITSPSGVSLIKDAQPVEKKSKGRRHNSKPSSTQQHSAQRSGSLQMATPSVNPNQGTYIPYILNNDAEKEMDQNLADVDRLMVELGMQATDMNEELRTHNQILGRINDKMTGLNTKIQVSQRHADDYLGKKGKKDENVLPSKGDLIKEAMFK